MNGSVFSGPSDRRLHDFRAIGRGIGRCFFLFLSRDCGRNAKSHECHSEPQAKNLTMPASCKSEILRLTPQDDIRHNLQAEKEQFEAYAYSAILLFRRGIQWRRLDSSL